MYVKNIFLPYESKSGELLEVKGEIQAEVCAEESRYGDLEGAIRRWDVHWNKERMGNSSSIH